MPASTPDADHSPIPAPRLTLAHADHPEIDLEIKRSHFLGRAGRTDSEQDARAFIASIRAQHPTARHHCSAFIIDNPGAQPTERSSDDGEPSGTAGGPMLEVLRGSGLTNVTVVVTRYFGGTLLGTGGLVRAYTDATLQALGSASRVILATRFLWMIDADHALAARVEADLRAVASQTNPPIPGGLTVEETQWTASGASLHVSTATPDDAPLAELLASLTAGALHPQPAGSQIIELPD